MTVPKFQDLLKNALRGDKQALDLWFEYSSQKKFDLLEITLASAAFKRAPKDGNLLFLQACWQYWGVGHLKEDKEKAYHLFEQAITLQHSEAMYRLGMIYCNEGNKDRGMNLLKQAAAVDHPEATSMLAWELELMDEDPDEQGNLPLAIHYYEQAIALKDTFAMLRRAAMHILDEDYDRAFMLYDEAIKQGSTMAMYMRAYFYQHGPGEKSPLKAADLYDKILANPLLATDEHNKQVYTDALYQRGLMYEEGLGTEKNTTKALSYYEKANKVGFKPEAYYRSARLYQEEPQVNYRLAHKALKAYIKHSNTLTDEQLDELHILNAKVSMLDDIIQSTPTLRTLCQHLQNLQAYGEKNKKPELSDVAKTLNAILDRFLINSIGKEPQKQDVYQLSEAFVKLVSSNSSLQKHEKLNNNLLKVFAEARAVLLNETELKPSENPQKSDRSPSI